MAANANFFIYMPDHKSLKKTDFIEVLKKGYSGLDSTETCDIYARLPLIFYSTLQNLELKYTKMKKSTIFGLGIKKGVSMMQDEHGIVITECSKMKMKLRMKAEEEMDTSLLSALCNNRLQFEFSLTKPVHRWIPKNIYEMSSDVSEHMGISKIQATIIELSYVFETIAQSEKAKMEFQNIKDNFSRSVLREYELLSAFSDIYL